LQTGTFISYNSRARNNASAIGLKTYGSVGSKPSDVLSDGRRHLASRARGGPTTSVRSG
jgi:hypothetical protein